MDWTGPTVNEYLTLSEAVALQVTLQAHKVVHSAPPPLLVSSIAPIPGGGLDAS